MDKTAALSGIPSLSSLPQPLISRLAKVSGIQHIRKGSTLFREGERAQFVYALIEGTVSLVNGIAREEAIAEFKGAGEVILLPPALLRLPYIVTAKAITDLRVVMIPAEEFRYLAETELPLSVAINHMLARHWRLLLQHLTQTKSRDADSRLAQYFLGNAGTTTGAAQFAIPGTKQNLAAHLGMTPATLSRSLKRLSRWGVKTSRTEIQIDDIVQLKRFIYHSTGPTPLPASFMNATL